MLLLLHIDVSNADCANENIIIIRPVFTKMGQEMSSPSRSIIRTLVIFWISHSYLIRAAATSVKHGCELKNILNTFAKSKISLTEKLTNGASVTLTPGPFQDWRSPCICNVKRIFTINHTFSMFERLNIVFDASQYQMALYLGVERQAGHRQIMRLLQYTRPTNKKKGQRKAREKMTLSKLWCYMINGSKFVLVPPAREVITLEQCATNITSIGARDASPELLSSMVTPYQLPSGGRTEHHIGCSLHGCKSTNEHYV